MNPTKQDYINWHTTLNDTTDDIYWENFNLFAEHIIMDVAMNSQVIVAKRLHITPIKFTSLFSLLKSIYSLRQRTQKSTDITPSSTIESKEEL